jgi:hypothetical protein
VGIQEHDHRFTLSCTKDTQNALFALAHQLEKDTLFWAGELGLGIPEKIPKRFQT